MTTHETHTVNGNKVVKGDWTFWRDFDGIYLLMPGSNSCWAGFTTNKEAEMFAETLDGTWTVHRNGIFKNLSDIDAHSDTVVIFQRLLFGFTVVTQKYFENVEEYMLPA